jgi:hypothetical protein
MQKQIKQMIKEYEEEIEKLLQTKRSCKPGDELYSVCEIKVLQLQNVISDLRSLI